MKTGCQYITLQRTKDRIPTVFRPQLRSAGTVRELNGLVEHLGPQWVPAKRLLAVRTDPLHWSVCKTVAMVDCSVFPVLFGDRTILPSKRATDVRHKEPSMHACWQKYRGWLSFSFLFRIIRPRQCLLVARKVLHGKIVETWEIMSTHPIIPPLRLHDGVSEAVFRSTLHATGG